jgi:transcriptional regulator with XRE-family HTH domain
MSEQVNGAREVLQAARQSLGLSYAGFALALGINKSTLCRYEAGHLPMPRTVELAVRGLLADAREV